MRFVYAMMSLHMIHWEKNVVYTKQNRRLSFEFECQSHNFANKPLNHCLLSQIKGGGGGEGGGGGNPSIPPPSVMNVSPTLLYTCKLV